MPKKFTAENSKAVQARSKKSAAKDAEAAKKQKEAEDAYWKDDDKQVLKKMQRKQESEQKKQQALQKKAEKKALLENEMSSIKDTTKQPEAKTKITRAQIQAETEKKNDVSTNKPKTIVVQPLEENINRSQPEEVNTIDEVLKVLTRSSAEAEDLNPEKRMKAAYKAYEEKNLPRLKAENPTLRLSQLKAMLYKDWK